MRRPSIRSWRADSSLAGFKALLGAALSAWAAVAPADMDLAGVWTLRMCDDPAVSCPASVPGGIYAPLAKAGKVPHPYYAMNEGAAQWPAEKRWSFSRTFTPPADLLGAPSVTLRLEDVDCFATIRLNGQEVGRTANRFQRYDFDVSRVLRARQAARARILRLAVREDRMLAHSRRAHDRRRRGSQFFVPAACAPFTLAAAPAAPLVIFRALPPAA